MSKIHSDIASFITGASFWECSNSTQKKNALLFWNIIYTNSKFHTHHFITHFQGTWNTQQEPQPAFSSFFWGGGRIFHGAEGTFWRNVWGNISGLCFGGGKFPGANFSWGNVHQKWPGCTSRSPCRITSLWVYQSWFGPRRLTHRHTHTDSLWMIIYDQLR